MCGHQRATSAGGKSGGRRKSSKSKKSDTQQGLVNDVLAQQHAGRLRRRRTSGQSLNLSANSETPHVAQQVRSCKFLIRALNMA